MLCVDVRLFSARTEGRIPDVAKVGLTQRPDLAQSQLCQVVVFAHIVRKTQVFPLLTVFSASSDTKATALRSLEWQRTITAGSLDRPCGMISFPKLIFKDPTCRHVWLTWIKDRHDWFA